MANSANVEIYKEIKHGEECWSIYWITNDPGYDFYKSGFKTFYDAELFARKMSYNTMFTSDSEDFFDELGNIVYTSEKARYKLVKPNTSSWRIYQSEYIEYLRLTRKWNKWYMRIIAFFHKPEIEKPKHPEYKVFDLKRKMTICSCEDPLRAVQYIRDRHKSTSVYYYDDDIKLVSKE